VIVTPVGSSVISVNQFEVLRNKVDVDHQRAQERIVWKKNTPSIELKGTLTGINRSAATRLLLDSGTTEDLISERLVKKERMKELSILQPIDLVNANNTMSVIKTQVRVKLTIEGDNGSHTKEISLYVGDIGSHNVLLGMPWLSITIQPLDGEHTMSQWTNAQTHAFRIKQQQSHHQLQARRKSKITASQLHKC
jgi:hypothetical protein